jgi:hypothetical protein
MHLIYAALRWSEVWATLIPVFIWWFKKPKALIPVKTYLSVALGLNILIDLAYYEILKNNNFLYNISSICRLFLFMWFFSLINIPLDYKKRNLFFLGAVFIILFNFIFLDSFVNFSSKMFTLEGIVLICYCISYFLKKLKSDEIVAEFDAPLYIVTGLAIYEAVCFPIFLFFNTLSEQTADFAIDIWSVHNIAYIVFCFFIARAFYGTFKHNKQ